MPSLEYCTCSRGAAFPNKKINIPLIDEELSSDILVAPCTVHEIQKKDLNNNFELLMLIARDLMCRQRIMRFDKIFWTILQFLSLL